MECPSKSSPELCVYAQLHYKNTCFVPCSHHLCLTQNQGTGEQSFAVMLILRVESHSKGQTTQLLIEVGRDASGLAHSYAPDFACDLGSVTPTFACWGKTKVSRLSWER